MSESFVTEVSTASAAASSAAIGCLLIHEGDFTPRYAIKVTHLHLHILYSTSMIFTQKSILLLRP